ncbi:MAG: DNA-binding protein WhiA [Lachnospiraceae bacterium]|nr:DNA-binding protein WhiA [Lachnospiraceae bacterium]
MSFSQEIKEELAEQMSPARHCQLAELAALVGACGVYGIRCDRSVYLLLQSENILVIRKAARLLRRAFRIQPEVSVYGNGDWRKGRLYTLAILEREAAGQVLKAVKYLSQGGVLRELSLPSNGLLLQQTCCRRAFIRGCFLASGSISDPRKSYHFEIVCGTPERAEQLRDAIRSFEVDAKIVPRKKSWVVYVKESDGIADMLNVMEAHRGLMNLENIRILRGISGHVNRSVNCETANLNKTVSASVEQIRDIEKIQRTIGLGSLPDSLRQMAEVRLEYPDLPLKELGAYLDPPVGKSGVNHRLRKIKAIAEEL